MPLLVHSWQKAIGMASLNQQKINQNPGLDLKVSFVVLPNVPRIVAKVEASRMPDDKFGHNKCQDSFATMPKIGNLKTKSKG